MNITGAGSGPLSELSTAVRPHICGQRMQAAASRKSWLAWVCTEAVDLTTRVLHHNQGVRESGEKKSEVRTQKADIINRWSWVLLFSISW